MKRIKSPGIDQATGRAGPGGLQIPGKKPELFNSTLL